MAAELEHRARLEDERREWRAAPAFVRALLAGTVRAIPATPGSADVERARARFWHRRP